MVDAYTLEPLGRVAALRACMPDLIATHPDRDALLEAFEEQAQLILDAVSSGSERRYAWRTIQFILIDFGYMLEYRIQGIP